MKTKISILGIVFLFLTLTFNSPVKGQVAGGMLVSSFIDDTKNAIQDIMNDGDFIISKNSFEIRQHLLLIIDNLDKLGHGLLDKTFDQLDDKVRLSFNQMNNTINNFDSTAANTLNRLDETIGNLNDAFSTIPGSKAQPRILKYTPNAVGDVWNNNIVFKGSFLGKTKNISLIFNGVECKLISSTENQMIFEYPQKLSSSNSVEKLYGDLNFEYKKGLFSKKKNINYKVLMFNIPNKFGSYNLESIVEKQEKEVKNSVQEFGNRNEHCQRNVKHTYNVTNTQGWEIDTDSIKVKVNATKNSQFNGII